MKIRGQLGHKLAQLFPDIEFKILPDGVVLARCWCYTQSGRRSRILAADMTEAIAWAGTHEHTPYHSWPPTSTAL
jgi:hypothetical protein